MTINNKELFERLPYPKLCLINGLLKIHENHPKQRVFQIAEFFDVVVFSNEIYSHLLKLDHKGFFRLVEMHYPLGTDPKSYKSSQDFRCFELSFGDKQMVNLKLYYENYLESFAANKIIFDDQQFYYENQRTRIIKYIKNALINFHPACLIIDSKVIFQDDEKYTSTFEILLILEKEGVLKIKQLSGNHRYNHCYAEIEILDKKFFEDKGSTSYQYEQDRNLSLIWTGFEIMDAQNKDCSISCRKGFPKNLLAKCFEDPAKPRRILPRSEFDLSPKETKECIKTIVTNWSNKFQVSRSRIEKIIHYKNRDGDIHISENIKFGARGYNLKF